MKCPDSILILLLLVSCTSHGQFSYDDVGDSPRWLKISDSLIVSVSPFDSSADSLVIHEPLTSIACMSSSYAAGFAEIGAASVVSGVSGRAYLSNGQIRSSAVELGSDVSFDYEALLRLRPQLLLAYGVSSVTPIYINKLRELGIPVLLLYDHLETSPLARAEYMRAYGRLCGRSEQADSVFDAVKANYLSICDRRCGAENGAVGQTAAFEPGKRVRVLMNAPFGDAWYIPGRDSYMNRLIEDAGGEILGAEPGIESKTITLEMAVLLSEQADFWLHPGPAARPKAIKTERIYDNTRRLTPGGGNDYWERGAVRPDLILEDLCKIFSGRDSLGLYFYEKSSRQ